MTTQINQAVLMAATGMLLPFFPDLTPTGLLDALKARKNETATANQPEKPLTRQEAANLLNISLVTLNGYMNTGLLRRVKIGPRLVRVDPQSVRDLLNQREAL